MLPVFTAELTVHMAFQKITFILSLAHNIQRSRKKNVDDKASHTNRAYHDYKNSEKAQFQDWCTFPGSKSILFSYHKYHTFQYFQEQVLLIIFYKSKTNKEITTNVENVENVRIELSNFPLCVFPCFIVAGLPANKYHSSRKISKHTTPYEN